MKYKIVAEGENQKVKHSIASSTYRIPKSLLTNHLLKGRIEKVY